MDAIQIGALIYFTAIVVGAWIFFAVIFLQLKRFINMSCYSPHVSKVLTVILIILTILGYILIFSPSLLEKIGMTSTTEEDSTPARPSGNFETY